MADIVIKLLNTRNSIGTANNISLSLQRNEFYIVAGEQNATEIEIQYDTTAFAGYTFYVEMVNAAGYGINKTQLENNSQTSWVKSATTFVLPAGLAVAGYAYISISAEKIVSGERVMVVFVPVAIKVQNTLPDWREEVSVSTSLYISAGGQLIYVDDYGTETSLGAVVGTGVTGITASGTSIVFALSDGTSQTVSMDTTDCTAVTQTELATLVANSIDTDAYATSSTTPSVQVDVINNKARFSFTLPQGQTGATGADGADGVGVSSITKTGTSGLVDTYTITLTNGNTSTFTVTNGAAGATGVGVSTISVSNGYLVFGLTDGTSIPVALPVYDGTGD